MLLRIECSVPHSSKRYWCRWTKKNKQTFFGYKNHVKEDVKSKLITKYKVTSAEVHDSQVTDQLLDVNDKGEPFYADSAYTGEPQEKIIASKGMENRVCEKGYKNRPLTEEQKSNNTEKSRIRSRVSIFLDLWKCQWMACTFTVSVSSGRVP